MVSLVDYLKRYDNQNKLCKYDFLQENELKTDYLKEIWFKIDNQKIIVIQNINLKKNNMTEKMMKKYLFS